MSAINTLTHQGVAIALHIPFDIRVLENYGGVKHLPHGLIKALFELGLDVIALGGSFKSR